ncbi:hypothetical protein [Flavonifractor hominis]|uniref:Uncharacterized protein n=1 Tax=Flavonifractor hominis TaxID=3133178 RepID=A0ABV1ELX0_9FIRM
MKKQKERPHCLRAQTAGPTMVFVHENHHYDITNISYLQGGD